MKWNSGACGVGDALSCQNGLVGALLRSREPSATLMPSDRFGPPNKNKRASRTRCDITDQTIIYQTVCLSCPNTTQIRGFCQEDANVCQLSEEEEEVLSSSPRDLLVELGKHVVQMVGGNFEDAWAAMHTG